ncbi:tyrosine-type recombinase/integrase [Bacillus sp. S/N-304-OC-R1]|uniref:tyrosine-type recombinase/integrase n=1 Tax=Bacillus sp. S/N-304-OC-R1 TaxID=2758034 RepID=UPI001C8DB576|nr:tyrosine-type recombinase/integrase [Bacillus sp. S/N-304-OC-R1]MBY0124413.1 tyrosine-type recombinase/integrase [Bacillus sp. S/N-304-OC-R1]
MALEKEDHPQFTIQDEIQTLLKKYGQIQVEKELGSVGILLTEQKNPKNKEITLLEAAQHFLEDEFSTYQSVSPSSQSSYKSETRSFCKYFGVNIDENISTDVLLKEVLTPEKLEAYIKQPGIADATRRKKAAFLRTFIDSVARDLLSETKINQFKKKALHLDDPDPQPPRAFTAKQIDYLLNLSRLTRCALRNYTILWTLVGTGIRVDELHFQIGDVNLEKGWIKVKAKGRKERAKVKRFMTKGAITAIKYYINFTYSHLKNVLSETDYNRRYVFSDDNGKQALSNRAIQKMVRGLIDKAIEDKVIQDKVWDSDRGEEVKVNYSTHSTRHSFAIYALESGMDIYIVKELLGHKSIESTQVYLNLFDEQYQKAIDKHPFAQLETDQLKHLGVDA